MNFGSSKAKTGANQPVIRRKTVQVPIKRAVGGVGAPVRQHDPNRFQPTSTSARPSPAVKAPQNPAKRAVLSSRGVKRKSVTPQRVIWSDDESDQDSSDIGGSDSDASRKRLKSTLSSRSSLGPKRPVLSEVSFKPNRRFDIIHGADATSGEFAHKFRCPWEDEVFEVCELQYPSHGQRERFELKAPKNLKEDYQPMDDIETTIGQICEYYFPDRLASKFHEEGGYKMRFNSATKRQNIDDFILTVKDFNQTLKGLIEDGTIRKELESRQQVTLDCCMRILDQIYCRTVSPKVETLRAYENGTDNVYGELLPRFVSEIFKKTNMTHDMTFVDLGSGVGNVVLQAALEVGCESWGIEQMPNPCDLAELQEREFPERAKLWGLKSGKVKLLRGDFTTNKEIGDVLKRADVVLVNNQAFTPALNDVLLRIFLDLRDGCQVVSLKPFVPHDHKISSRNSSSPVNLFTQRKFEYFSNSVSWGAGYGDWYIATKDPAPLAQYLKLNKIR